MSAINLTTTSVSSDFSASNRCSESPRIYSSTTYGIPFSSSPSWWTWATPGCFSLNNVSASSRKAAAIRVLRLSSTASSASCFIDLIATSHWFSGSKARYTSANAPVPRTDSIWNRPILSPAFRKALATTGVAGTSSLVSTSCCSRQVESKASSTESWSFGNRW